jgi:hypothetical protein
VLRIPGESRGADIEMAKAKELGKTIFMSLDEIPNVSSGLSGDFF